jgi:hypothetical protein
MPITIGPAASVRTFVKPPLAQSFYVAVDRQLKSGYETYAGAEKAAREIKRRYPKLHVTVFDTKEQRHVLIEQPKLLGVSNNNQIAALNAVGRLRAAVDGH